MAEAYALWAPDYPPRAHNRLMALEEQAVLEMMPDVAGHAALDLACGSGRYLRVLMQRGATPVVGLDFSTPMLTQAKAVASNLVLADLLSLSLRASSFDVVTCGLAVGHVEDLTRAVREIGRVLTPGGTLVYSDFHPVGYWLGWRRTFRAADSREYEVPHHTHLFADHVAACSSAGMRIEEVREPRIDFAHKWQGCPALLVIRARKEA